MPIIRQADSHDLDKLVPLVDGYRQFYEQPSDSQGVRRFMTQRFEQGDAYVLIALSETEEAIGFAQLFPVPATTDLAMRWILNDLFVSPQARRQGIGSELLKAARQLAQDHGVPKLMLRTQVDNVTAQSRYRALGWQRDESFYTYFLTL